MYMGQYKEAIDYFARDTFSQGYNLFFRGITYFYLKNFHQAISDFSYVIEIITSTEYLLAAHFGRGISYLSIDKISEAKKDINFVGYEMLSNWFSIYNLCIGLFKL
jgi:tetratricopeptide (TPR) repeat protein